MMDHSGIKKNLCNESMFEMYDVLMKGMESQYLFNLECFKNEMVDNEVKNMLMPPIRMALNSETIHDCVKAITSSHVDSPSSDFQKIKKPNFWGFSYDSIIKFGIDFLGIFIKGVNCEEGTPGG